MATPARSALGPTALDLEPRPRGPAAAGGAPALLAGGPPAPPHPRPAGPGRAPAAPPGVPSRGRYGEVLDGQLVVEPLESGLLEVGQLGVDGVRRPWRDREAPALPVLPARAQAAERGGVLGRGVPLVLLPAVPGEPLAPLHHDLVALHLGEH